MAGTQFRGQFEQRVKGLLSEVKAAGNIILFIDEIHTITSAGESEGAMNAGNILKPALSRGEIQVIGATTFNEYRKYIEKDAGAGAPLSSPSGWQNPAWPIPAVMNGIKHYYEEHHHVQVAADVLTPSSPSVSGISPTATCPIRPSTCWTKPAPAAICAHPVISEYLEMQKELDALRQEEADMEDPPTSKRPSTMSGGRAEDPHRQARGRAARKAGCCQRDQGDHGRVAKVIELWTGIPAVKIRDGAPSWRPGGALHKKIIGQDEAVRAVAQAVRRSRADLSGRRRPGSFIFVGPTGVGKTELVQACWQTSCSTAPTRSSVST